MSEHLTTENAGNGEVVGEKTSVAEVHGVHLDLDPFEAHCDTYRIDDKQDGTSSLSPKSDLHNMVGIASGRCHIMSILHLKPPMP